MIPFNKPPYIGDEVQNIISAINSGKISGDGQFSKRCNLWFEQKLSCKKVLLTPNCTQALEMCAILIDIKPGDEVIMPSYTFVSTANAFVLRGATIVFVDIRADTMNINEKLIEAAITHKTKAIVVVHYAGVGCEMDLIMDIADRNGLFVIEDAAQGMMSTYKGKPLGTIGHLGAYSFHETKNYTSGGEGGLLIINHESFIERSEIIREKGTNRSKFFRGMVDKYSWVDVGSSYLLSEIQAAFLWPQLESAEKIKQNRLKTWMRYYASLESLSHKISLPIVPSDCEHNAHMFYIKTSDLKERTSLIEHLASQKIQAVFHYLPLHSSVAGKHFSRFNGEDIYTTAESEKLVRLPFFYGLTSDENNFISSQIRAFFS
jgi:dTDP-4-amino-4,6-dideoxygalactose transaminase